MALDPLLFTASPTGARSKYPVIWRAVMKILRFPLALVAPLIFGGAVRGDDTPAPRGPLASGGNVPQVLQDVGKLPTTSTTSTNSPFSRGLGQVVSDWSRDGIHGPELADRIHSLQQARRSNQTDPSFSRDRDLREDRREIRDDRTRLRDDERRVSRDREELRRDQADLRRDREGDPRSR